MSQTYTVKKGDTLYGISNQFGVAAIDMYNLNKIIGPLQIGQVLIVPDTQGTNPSGLFTYTVQKGDSLYSIAKKYSTTVQEIISLNHLTNNNLSIGQKLSIPESGEEDNTLPSFINYTVQKGDNLYSIAKKYNLTVDQILKDNGLTNTNLSIGQNLKIRTDNTSVVEECYGEEYTPPANTNSYTVQKGDSLYSIAKEFGISVDSLKNKNNLTSNTLVISQILNI